MACREAAGGSGGRPRRCVVCRGAGAEPTAHPPRRGRGAGRIDSRPGEDASAARASGERDGHRTDSPSPADTCGVARTPHNGGGEEGDRLSTSPLVGEVGSGSGATEPGGGMGRETDRRTHVAPTAGDDKLPDRYDQPIRPYLRMTPMSDTPNPAPGTPNASDGVPTATRRRNRRSAARPAVRPAEPAAAAGRAGRGRGVPAEPHRRQRPAESDRPRNDGSIPMPLDKQDFAAAKPNKRALDADIEAEMAAAMGAVDVTARTGQRRDAAEAGRGGGRGQPAGRPQAGHGDEHPRQGRVHRRARRPQPGDAAAPAVRGQARRRSGDVVEFSIERYDAANGLLVLTMTGAAQHVSDWSSVALHMIVECKVTGVNKNRTGLMVEVSGIKGFMPISQIDLGPGGAAGAVRRPDAEGGGGRTGPGRAEPDPQPQVAAGAGAGSRSGRSSGPEIEVGQTRTGIVRGLQPFGAFVDLGASDGLIPVHKPGCVTAPRPGPARGRGARRRRWPGRSHRVRQRPPRRR